MSNPCDREGRWAAAVKEVRPQESASGSIMIWITVQLAHLWNQQEQKWTPWQQYDAETKGGFCLVTKKGDLMDRQVEQLCKALDWDGDPDSLTQRDWSNVTVQVTTKWDTYNGGSYRLQNIYHIDSNPDQRLNLNPEMKMRLEALARNARTPASAPPPVAAPVAGTPAPPAMPPIQPAHTLGDDNIPM